MYLGSYEKESREKKKRYPIVAWVFESCRVHIFLFRCEPDLLVQKCGRFRSDRSLNFSVLFPERRGKRVLRSTAEKCLLRKSTLPRIMMKINPPHLWSLRTSEVPHRVSEHEYQIWPGKWSGKYCSEFRPARVLNRPV